MRNIFTPFSTRLNRSAALLVLLLLPLLGWGQTTIFNETFGTPSGTNQIAAYAAGTAPATFSTKSLGYTYSQGGATNASDIRATSVSSSYTGASGSGNTFFANSNAEYGFAINDINASNFTNLSLSFGLRKEAAAAYSFVLDYSIDGGTTYTAVTVSSLPSNTAALGWYGITGVSLPAAAQVANLSLRFRKTSTTTGIRIDDIILKGTTAIPTGPTLTANPATLTGFAYVQGAGPSTSQSFNLSGTNLTGAPGNITVTGSASYDVSADNTSFGGTATVAYTSATLTNTPVYVRLKAGLGINSSISETIGIAGGGSTASVTASGNVTAPATAPTGVSTAPATAITATSATSGGTVTADGGSAITGRGVVYSLTAGPRLNGTGVTAVTATGTTGSFTSNLTGLMGGTTYYVAAYATNGVGTTYGADVSFTTLTPPAFFEDFETGTKASYNSGSNDATVTTGSWNFFESLIANVGGSDRGNDIRTVRLRGGGQVSMNFDKPNGAGTVSVNAAQYGTDVSSFKVEVSNNMGATYTDITGTSPVLTNTVTTYSFMANLPGMVRVRISSTAGNSGSNPRLNIDDVGITNFAGTPPPTLTSFTPTTGPVGTQVTITGTGFVAGTTVAFNGTAATAVTVVSATSIQATVPTGATSGTISVSNANGTATSTGTFTVTTPGAVLAAGYLLLEDDFNYATGTRLNANGWAVHSGSGSDAPRIIAGNLTNATYPTGPLALNPNHAFSNGTAIDVNKGFTVPSGLNTVYYSALINIPTGGTFPDYFLHLLERTNAGGTTANNFRAKLFARPGTTANTYNLGISITSNPNETPAPSYTTTEYAEGQTYLAVVKYEYVAGGSDRVSLFAFDNATAIPTTEPAPLTSLQETNNPAFAIPSGIAIRQNTNTPVVDLDGIRVATGWGAVTGNPVYTEAAAVINAGNYYAVTMNDAAARLTPSGAVNIENNLTLTNGLINTTAANSLTLYQPATVSGGGSTSFVNGPVQRLTDVISTAVSMVFPVGKGTAYRPLTLNITDQSDARTYVAEQFNSSARTTALTGPGSGTASAAAPLTRVSNIRYFTLAPLAATGTFSGTATLSFEADDFVNYPADTRFVVAKRTSATNSPSTPAGDWGNIGRNSSTGTANGGLPVSGTLTSDVFTTFSDFALASTADASNNALNTSNPLPVELTAFTAQRQPDGSSVSLKWATATERNSARFEVQRSLDGREFSTVATVAAAGTSTQPTTYAALDKAAPATTLYYRLRQVDRNGTFAFSSVATVAGSSLAGKVLLYPNPAHAELRASVPAQAGRTYRILNALGQVMAQGPAEAANPAVNVQALPVGTYFLELRSTEGPQVHRFVKAE